MVIGIRPSLSQLFPSADAFSSDALGAQMCSAASIPETDCAAAITAKHVEVTGAGSDAIVTATVGVTSPYVIGFLNDAYASPDMATPSSSPHAWVRAVGLVSIAVVVPVPSATDRGTGLLMALPLGEVMGQDIALGAFFWIIIAIVVVIFLATTDGILFGGSGGGSGSGGASKVPPAGGGGGVAPMQAGALSAAAYPAGHSAGPYSGGEGQQQQHQYEQQWGAPRGLAETDQEDQEKGAKAAPTPLLEPTKGFNDANDDGEKAAAGAPTQPHLAGASRNGEEGDNRVEEEKAADAAAGEEELPRSSFPQTAARASVAAAEGASAPSGGAHAAEESDAAAPIAGGGFQRNGVAGGAAEENIDHLPRSSFPAAVPATAATTATAVAATVSPPAAAALRRSASQEGESAGEEEDFIVHDGPSAQQASNDSDLDGLDRDRSGSDASPEAKEERRRRKKEKREKKERKERKKAAAAAGDAVSPDADEGAAADPLDGTDNN